MVHKFCHCSLITPMLIMLVSSLLFSGMSSAQSARPRTVVDYYLLLPNKYTYDVPRQQREQLINNNGRIIAKDIENGYLAISGDGGDPGITVALFKESGEEYLIGVSVFNEMTKDLYFLRYRRSKWSDVTRSVIPAFSKANEYNLPRSGTTIEVNGKSGKKLYDLVWSDGRFVIKRK